MSNIWLTSDLHFGHSMVAKHRGFDDVTDHDVRIQRNWQKMVRAADTVWVLGDISSGGAIAQHEALKILEQLPGKKHLVTGNHDSVSPIHGNAPIRWDSIYREVFDYICSQAFLRVEGVKLMLSHFPFTHDRGETRYPEWRLPDTGNWLAHGHTHEAVVWSPDRPREYHVGLDAHGLKLVPLGEVGRFIKTHMDTHDQL